MDLKNLHTKGNAPIVVGGSYTLQDRLGGGSFGQLYSAIHRGTGTLLAVKLEQKSSRVSSLPREAKIMFDMVGEPGFATAYSYGKEESFNFLVMDLLGFNLEKLLKICGHQFSLKTVLMMADQMLTRIESLHKQGFIHRDIKPENFCMGKEDKDHTVFLIDFGLARSYKDENGQHIAYREKKGLVGTARYASINTHLGVEQSRRDDLEAIGYILVYFLKGELPWQNIKTKDKQEKYKLIADIKMMTSTEVLCKDLPEEFATYMNYVKGLGFTDNPNYKYMKKLFRTLFIQKNYSMNYSYDWSELIVNKKRDKKWRVKHLSKGLVNLKKNYEEFPHLVEPRRKVEFLNAPKYNFKQNPFNVKSKPEFIKSQPVLEDEFEEDSVVDPRDDNSPKDNNSKAFERKMTNKEKFYGKNKTPDLGDTADGRAMGRQTTKSTYKNGLTTSGNTSKVLETGDEDESSDEMDVPSEFSRRSYSIHRANRVRSISIRRKDFMQETKRFFASMYAGEDSLHHSKVSLPAKTYQSFPTAYQNDETGTYMNSRVKKSSEFGGDRSKKLTSTLRMGKNIGEWDILKFNLEEDLSEGSMCEWEEGSNYLSKIMKQKNFA